MSPRFRINVHALTNEEPLDNPVQAVAVDSEQPRALSRAVLDVDGCRDTGTLVGEFRQTSSSCLHRVVDLSEPVDELSRRASGEGSEAGGLK